MSLVMACDIPVNYLSSPYNSRLEGCPHMTCCSEFFDVYIKLGSSLQYLGERVVLVFRDEQTRKLKNNLKY